MTPQDILDRVCTLYGVASEYTDVWGHRHLVSAQTKQAVLAAMGVPVVTEADLGGALEEYDTRQWHRLLPPVQVVRKDQLPLRIVITVPTTFADACLHWSLREENGEQHQGDFRPRQLEGLEHREFSRLSYIRGALVLPHKLDTGYHWFKITGIDHDLLSGTSMSLIVVPETCYQPPALAGEGRVWGLAIQLYAVRSQRNWGIGDFSDLKTIVEVAAELGADMVGLNPLHALFPHNPRHVSPYSPSSRLFPNVFYLDVEAVPDFAECEAAQEAVQDPQFQARLRALRASDLVDYEGVAAAKFQILELLYRHFRAKHLSLDSARGRAFRAFQTRAGLALRQHALFESLQEHFHRQDASIWGWPAWPEAYRNPDSKAVAAFAAAHQERIEFFEYLQWQAELQLGAAEQGSLELGLGIGIYQDLAVSINGGGAEVWANQTLYALNAHIGAPPDEINSNGQDWGLPPLIPHHLREAAYKPFIETLRVNMRHAGALRIDHVMGLMRLYWIPPGSTPAEGTYVSYPFEDLLGILALESQRNQCLIIGEDLGTVPNTVREALQRSGILSYRLLYFEKTPEGSFKAPAHYPSQALVAVSTHDLPTLSGYWLGSDLDVRTELELFPSPEVREQQLVSRAQDRTRLLVALERESLLPPGMTVHPVSIPEITPELMRAVYLYLARTPAKVMVVQPEDVFGQREQINLPAITDQYPNWQRKLPVSLEDWRHNPRMQTLVEALRQERSVQQRLLHAAGWTSSLPVTAPIPRATYRLQFNRQFTFSQATALIPYLDALGISHCYASPYLKARPGSTHGYDIIDHNALNPEIGSPEQFECFVRVLKQHGMGQILDMVPNHMGVMGSDNAWWLDVLENGPAAIHARFFDIDWQPANEALRGKVLLPVLDKRYGVVLENGELQLVFDDVTGTFSVHHHEHCFPIDPREYPRILGHRLEQLVARLGSENPELLEYQSLITAFGHLPARHETTLEKRVERNRDKELHKQHLAELCRRSADIARFIQENAREFNGEVGELRSFARLHALLEEQAYRLAHWRVASDEINYRRFFDINDLAALRMQDEEVFQATHGLVLKLLGTGALDGLRIDHPDGLYHPMQYFQRIQTCFVPISTLPATNPEANVEPQSDRKPQAHTAMERRGHALGARYAGRGEARTHLCGARSTGMYASNASTSLPCYLVVEKILASYEHLPEDWPVHGTTGYDFANLVNGLFVDSASEARMEHIFTSFIGEPVNFDELLYQCKKLIMKVTLASELNMLANQLSQIAQADWQTRDFTLNSLREALLEVVACFPVYRTYITDQQVSTEDRRYVEWAVSVAKRRSQAADISVFDFIRDVLLTEAAEDKLVRGEGRGEYPSLRSEESYREAVCSFAMKFQQYTGPVMAKGLEDTSFYLYNRLVSLNEVGGDPRRFGVSVAAFHRANQERAKHWPHAMLCTSTHDSKRSEDVRARINVLSELTEEWGRYVQRWSRMNRSKKRLVDDKQAPAKNDEYLLYQTLIGTWPLEELDEAAYKAYGERIEQYMLKAVKEAKVHSSWVNPNTAYEAALTAFVRALLENPDKNLFLADFRPFQRRIARFGMFNSLSQSLLKFTSPGVPDIYQGNELWEFSLVDPDNRHPVDYARRQALLRAVQDLDTLAWEEKRLQVRHLLHSMEDGKIKLYVTWKSLALRKAYPEFLRDGDYHALNATGQKAEHVCAFARRYQDCEAIVVVPRLIARLLSASERFPLGELVWSDTYIELPPDSPPHYQNLFTGAIVSPERGANQPRLPLATVLADFPVALLTPTHLSL